MFGRKTGKMDVLRRLIFFLWGYPLQLLKNQSLPLDSFFEEDVIRVSCAFPWSSGSKLPDGAFENHYPELVGVADRILTHLQEFFLVFSINRLVLFLDVSGAGRC